jgi:hypothetical protein
MQPIAAWRTFLLAQTLAFAIPHRVEEHDDLRNLWMPRETLPTQRNQIMRGQDSLIPIEIDEVIS